MKKPLICDQCPATFLTQFSLKKHREKHGRSVAVVNPKPGRVYCKYCKVAFLTIDLLSAHMEMEHDQKVKVKMAIVPGKVVVDALSK